jgi:hypothetical protein
VVPIFRTESLLRFGVLLWAPVSLLLAVPMLAADRPCETEGVGRSSGQARISRTLLTAIGDGPYPAVVFTHGSSPFWIIGRFEVPRPAS